MISAGIEELNDSEQFRQANRPILRRVIARMGGAAMVASGSRPKSVFRACLTMQAAGIEELNDSE